MKKSIGLIGVALLLVFSSGCNQDSTANIEDLEKKIVDLEKENEELRNELEKNSKRDEKSEEFNNDPSPTDSMERGNTDKSSENELAMEQIIEVENFAEFSLKNITFSKKVIPPKADGFYSYYEAENDGNTFIDITLRLKNLQTSAQDASEFLNVKVIYDEKYEYNAFSIIESDGGEDFDSAFMEYIDPLMTENLHFLAEVPESLTSDEKPMEVVITIQGETYTHQFK